MQWMSCLFQEGEGGGWLFTSILEQMELPIQWISLLFQEGEGGGWLCTSILE